MADEQPESVLRARVLRDAGLSSQFVHQPLAAAQRLVDQTSLGVEKQVFEAFAIRDRHPCTRGRWHQHGDAGVTTGRGQMRGSLRCEVARNCSDAPADVVGIRAEGRIHTIGSAD
ncbi:hypothetical protein [Nocardioides okcheonensis]|uniref:hypothetical protein n=1 Tax=Nocardioides okcheonensis TaxID=2894081 RepID=UPI001E3CE086|nr:hypothetical protein [Nocardioides okcheonensis]UFN45135.1 hypothetical protein LN652_02630 [Nocardioides okcheonensis]